MATNRENPAKDVPEWIVQMENEFENAMPKSQPKTTLEHTQKNEKEACIYRFSTPADLDSNFTPLKVKFSPYYHAPQSIPDVKKMMKPILAAFHGRGTLGDCYKAVRGVLEELKMSYDQLDQDWENANDAFLELMFLSGCYLLELLRCITDDSNSEYRPDNPLLRVREEPREREAYKHDMLLLQNQLPIRLLQVLLKAEGCNNVSIILGKYISKAFSLGKLPTSIFVPQGKHILDVVRKVVVGYSSVFDDFKGIGRSAGSYFNIPTATVLKNVGIRVTNSDRTYLTHISFERRTLKIPKIFIDHATISRFLNMVVFEDHYKKVGNEVTSYLYFMRFLVKDKEDFKLLQSRGVINTPMSLDEVFPIFESMIKYAQLDSDHMSKKYFQVGKTLKKRHNELSVEWKKDLRLNYLKSPWTIISVVAAILLFALTAIQTVFTVLSYVHPK